MNDATDRPRQNKDDVRQKSIETGMSLALVCLLVFLLGGERGFVVAGTAVLALTMAYPSVFRPISRVWLAFAATCGAVGAKVVLSVVFYGLVTPVGAVRRLLGTDSLQLRRFGKGEGSAFTVRDKTYAAKDVETPY